MYKVITSGCRRMLFVALMETVACLLAPSPLLFGQDDIQIPEHFSITQSGVIEIRGQLNESMPLMETASAEALSVATFSHLISAHRSDDSGIQRIAGDKYT